MQVIAEIKEKLKATGITVADRQDGISVLTAQPTGFDVSIVSDNGLYTIFFNGWQLDSFPESETKIATELFYDLLTNKTRLVVSSRGKTDVAWALEENCNGSWQRIAYISRLGPFWRRKQIRYLQNKMPQLGPNNSFKPKPLRGSA